MSDPRPIGEIVGVNVRRMRTGAGHSGDALARELKDFGPWNTARVADLERGRVSPTAANLYAVSHGLSRLLERTVLISDLIRDGGDAKVGKVSIPAEVVADAFAGRPTTLLAASEDDTVEEIDPEGYFRNYRGPKVTPEENRAMIAASGEAERRLALSLGLSDQELAGWSQKLWGKTFSARRDELSDERSNPQQRGQVSRKLKAELKAEVARVNRLFADAYRQDRENTNGDN